MIETLISSKTRIKLLVKFFLNSEVKSYLRNLESEFGDSTNSIRIELNRFEKAGLLLSEESGNKKMFFANKVHPLFKDIQNILFKYVGVTGLVEKIVESLGDLEAVYITGSLSQGKDVGIIDLILIGSIDKIYLNKILEKAELMIKRKIKFLVFSGKDFDLVKSDPIYIHSLLVWSK